MNNMNSEHVKSLGNKARKHSAIRSAERYGIFFNKQMRRDIYKKIKNEEYLYFLRYEGKDKHGRILQGRAEIILYLSGKYLRIVYSLLNDEVITFLPLTFTEENKEKEYPFNRALSISEEKINNKLKNALQKVEKERKHFLHLKQQFKKNYKKELTRELYELIKENIIKENIFYEDTKQEITNVYCILFINNIFIILFYNKKKKLIANFISNCYRQLSIQEQKEIFLKKTENNL